MILQKARISAVFAASLCLLLSALNACESDGGGGGGVSSADAKANCVPSRTVWEDTTKAMVTQHCGGCHGEKPSFGAPNTLLDYDDLIKGKEGERKVDRIVARMANKTMPAAGQTPPPHQVVDTVVEWASCGAVHPDHSVGLVVDRPVFDAPKTAPKDTEHFDLLAPEFAVGEKVLDLYMCFAFDTPVKADRFVRRIEPIVDDSRVLHHIVLLRDPNQKTKVGASTCKGMPGGSQYLYAWAPGAGPVQFPEGGLRVVPGERYIVQIHYNNGAGVTDAKDSSGVRIHHGKPEGTEYGMFAPGPVAFAIPDGTTHTATGTCKIKEKTTFIAGMPHMHELGTKFVNTIVRKDGKQETLIDIKGWQFEMQPFYSFPVTLEPGDKLLTSCTWENKTGKSVSFGAGTGDEMCFNFIFATPPPKQAYCNDFDVDASADVSYAPGKCAGDKAAKTAPKTATPLKFEAAPKVEGGTIGKGRWMLKSATLYLPSVTKAYLDEASFVVAKGQLLADGDDIVFDVATRVLLKLKGGQGTDNTQVTSVAGTMTAGDKTGEASLKLTCGGDQAMKFRYGAKDKTLTVIIDQKIQSYTVPAVYVFELE